MSYLNIINKKTIKKNEIQFLVEPMQYFMHVLLLQYCIIVESIKKGKQIFRSILYVTLFKREMELCKIMNNRA